MFWVCSGRVRDVIRFQLIISLVWKATSYSSLFSELDIFHFCNCWKPEICTFDKENNILEVHVNTSACALDNLEYFRKVFSTYRFLLLEKDVDDWKWIKLGEFTCHLDTEMCKVQQYAYASSVSLFVGAACRDGYEEVCFSCRKKIMNCQMVSIESPTSGSQAISGHVGMTPYMGVKMAVMLALKKLIAQGYG